MPGARCLANSTTFATQPLKLALLAVALTHAAWHLRAEGIPARAAVASLTLWLAVLVAGRMIAFA